MTATKLRTFPNTGKLAQALGEFVAEKSAHAVKTRSRFTVGLSGGSLPKLLAEGLLKREDIEWDAWEVFFCDERLVPWNSLDSNYRACKEALFDHVSIPEEQIHKVSAELLDDPEEAADEYQSQLIHVFAAMNSAKFPVFDLLLLGMGPDGHTCSLFPGEDHRDAVDEEYAWVTSIVNSPKPPPKRITFTLPVLNHSLAAAFVATGASKQDVLKRVIEDRDESLPAARIRLINNHELTWFLDDEAAAKLESRES